jgi:hypothetical protein
MQDDERLIHHGATESQRIRDDKPNLKGAATPTQDTTNASTRIAKIPSVSRCLSGEACSPSKRLCPLVTSRRIRNVLWPVYNQVNGCFAVPRNAWAFSPADIWRRAADV